MTKKAPVENQPTVSRSYRILRVLHITVLIASILLVAMVSVELFNLVPWLTEKRQLQIQFGICMIFLLDFLWGWIYAKRKGEYLKTNFVFLLVSIPYLNLFQYEGISFTSHVYYFVRLIPLLRGGYALFILITWLTKNRITSLFITYLVILTSAIYFCTMIFYTAEKGINPQVESIWDAFWWSALTVTTLGSNIVAMTAPGKISTIVVAVVGVLMFPIFTVFITDKIKEKKGNNSTETES